MTKKYVVNVHELWIQEVIVEAETPEEARSKVASGEGDYMNGGIELSHVLDNREEWVIVEEEEI